MRIIAIICLLVYIFYLETSSDKTLKITEDFIQEVGEGMYFEGQKDALDGIFNIKQVDDSCWIWVGSPWEDLSKKELIFNPCLANKNYEYEIEKYLN
ncbi:MAG: hypothetical protein ACOC1K_02380 [Nanoarchaeota archaeon]